MSPEATEITQPQGDQGDEPDELAAARSAETAEAPAGAAAERPEPQTSENVIESINEDNAVASQEALARIIESEKKLEESEARNEAANRTIDKLADVMRIQAEAMLEMAKRRGPAYEEAQVNVGGDKGAVDQVGSEFQQNVNAIMAEFSPRLEALKVGGEEAAEEPAAEMAAEAEQVPEVAEPAVAEAAVETVEEPKDIADLTSQRSELKQQIKDARDRLGALEEDSLQAYNLRRQMRESIKALDGVQAQIEASPELAALNESRQKTEQDLEKMKALLASEKITDSYKAQVQGRIDALQGSLNSIDGEIKQMEGVEEVTVESSVQPEPVAEPEPEPEPEAEPEIAAEAEPVAEAPAEAAPEAPKAEAVEESAELTDLKDRLANRERLLQESEQQLASFKGGADRRKGLENAIANYKAEIEGLMSKIEAQQAADAEVAAAKKAAAAPEAPAVEAAPVEAVAEAPAEVVPEAPAEAVPEAPVEAAPEAPAESAAEEEELTELGPEDLEPLPSLDEEAAEVMVADLPEEKAGEYAVKGGEVGKTPTAEAPAETARETREIPAEHLALIGNADSFSLTPEQRKAFSKEMSVWLVSPETYQKMSRTEQIKTAEKENRLLSGWAELRYAGGRDLKLVDHEYKEGEDAALSAAGDFLLNIGLAKEGWEPSDGLMPVRYDSGGNAVMRLQRVQENGIIQTASLKLDANQMLNYMRWVENQGPSTRTNNRKRTIEQLIPALEQKSASTEDNNEKSRIEKQISLLRQEAELVNAPADVKLVTMTTDELRARADQSQEQTPPTADAEVAAAKKAAAAPAEAVAEAPAEVPAAEGSAEVVPEAPAEAVPEAPKAEEEELTELGPEDLEPLPSLDEEVAEVMVADLQEEKAGEYAVKGGEVVEMPTAEAVPEAPKAEEEELTELGPEDLEPLPSLDEEVAEVMVADLPEEKAGEYAVKGGEVVEAPAAEAEEVPELDEKDFELIPSDAEANRFIEQISNLGFEDLTKLKDTLTKEIDTLKAMITKPENAALKETLSEDLAAAQWKLYETNNEVAAENEEMAANENKKLLQPEQFKIYEKRRKERREKAEEQPIKKAA